MRYISRSFIPTREVYMLFVRIQAMQSGANFDTDVVLWLFDADDGLGSRLYARAESDPGRMGARLVTLRNIEDADGRHFGAVFVHASTTKIYLNETSLTINGRGKPHYELESGKNHRITIIYEREGREVLEVVTVCYSEPGTVFADTTEQTLVPGKNDSDEPITEEVPLSEIPIPSWSQAPSIGTPSSTHPNESPAELAPRKFYLGRNLLRVGFVLAILAPMGQDFPTIKLPSVTLPEIALPAVQLPQVTLPQLSLPSVAFPTIDLEPTPARLDGPWTVHRDGTLEFVHSGAIWSGDFFVEEGVIYQMNNKPLPEVCLTYYGWLPICPEIVRYSQTPALP